MSGKKHCGNCIFFGKEEQIAEGPAKGIWKGFCCVNPPQLMIAPGQQGGIMRQNGAMQMQAQSIGMQPPTNSQRIACKAHEWSEEHLLEQEKHQAAMQKQLEETMRVRDPRVV